MHLEERQVVGGEGLVFCQSRVEVTKLRRCGDFDRHLRAERREVVRIDEQALQHGEVLCHFREGYGLLQRVGAQADGRGEALQQPDVGLLGAAAAQFGMERLGELYAHLEGVHRCLVQEALQDLDEVLAEIMVLAEEQLQLAAAQILVLEGLEERVRVDGMVLQFVDQPIQEA